jgi:N-acetylmuramoyl-L-alanine amidase-like protein
VVNSSSRSGRQVIWVVIHTAEGIRKASDLKAYFERSKDSSSHAVADDSTLLDNLVPYDRAAWTLRNGNPRSDNLELCGFASWSRAEWLTHQGMLNAAARWIKSRCQARGIPIRKIGGAAVSRGESGVIGHTDYTQGTDDGSHWDPGPGFPWDVVMARASGGAPAPEPARGVIHREDQSMQVPKSTETRNIPIAWPGRAGRLVIAPGDSPVYLSQMFNWDNTSADGGTGGNPGAVQIGVRDPRTFDIPAGTLKVDFFYRSDDDFDVLRDV